MSMPKAATLFVFLSAALSVRAHPPPCLRRQGAATQLIVDGRPFLIRGGEVGNSSATHPSHLEPAWAKFKALNLNTLIVPVYWDLIEPAEGRYDFSTVDELLQQARVSQMRLVLLWFGTWKNSMSCYVPAWVKRNSRRFPRAEDRTGAPQEILSAFSAKNLRIDEDAFAALMGHLRSVDGARHTVLMVQVENEMGMIPTARDHSAAANRAFAGPVPAALTGYLASHSGRLDPGLQSVWEAAGGRRTGTWSEMFGDDPAGEEIFMAWYFARYADQVAAAGKMEYPLPMYVNAALIRPGYAPGQYPSGGPLPQLFDVWRAAAPAIDLFSPDIYFRNFSEWARRYDRPGNPLFIPEAQPSPETSVNALYAYGACGAIGFSAFSIDTVAGRTARCLAASYSLVAQLQQLILAHRGDGTMAGLLPQGAEELQPQEVRLGNYRLYAAFEHKAPVDKAGAGGGTDGPAALSPAGGLVIATGPDEFIVAGTGLTITFSSMLPGVTAGILSCEEGRFDHGAWQNILWLGGDQTDQGREIRLKPGKFTIQRVTLYGY